MKTPRLLAALLVLAAPAGACAETPTGSRGPETPAPLFDDAGNPGSDHTPEPSDTLSRGYFGSGN